MFTDLWNIAEICKVTPECDHWGLPREQYARTYVLLPPGYDSTWMHAAVEGGWNDWKYTFGGSADDAGLGQLEDKTVIIVNPKNMTSGRDCGVSTKSIWLS